MDIDSFWEYTNPSLSEERFREALKAAHGDDRLELLTQIARTYGLRQRFDEAHQILDEVEAQLPDAGPRPSIRYLLERGRTFNSSDEIEKARSLFLEAWQLAQSSNLDGLAVDAAHMVAITFSGTVEAVQWNQNALVAARSSEDPKARALIPAMLNNSAWDLQDMGRSNEALPLFQEALVEWTAREKPDQIRTAKWAVAHCLRSLGRHNEALAILQELEAEYKSMNTVDGYVFEEIAENLAALGRQDEAKLYFGKAADELGKDEWFVSNEVARLESLTARAGR